MKKFLMQFGLVAINICVAVAAQAIVLETFESSANQSPFNGTADLLWSGDISAFQVTTATWPTGAGQPPDFAGTHSLRSLANSVAGEDTVVTSLGGEFSSSATATWSVYVSGNSADISTVRSFSFLLLSDSTSSTAIEAGTINGYRLQLADDPGATGAQDILRLQVATGSGWNTIDSVTFASGVNVNNTWNLGVQRLAGGTWNWGWATNSAIGSAVALTESVVDTQVLAGNNGGMMWNSSTTSEDAFGFDNFSFVGIPEPSTFYLVAVSLGVLVRFGRRR